MAHISSQQMLKICCSNVKAKLDDFQGRVIFVVPGDEMWIAARGYPTAASVLCVKLWISNFPGVPSDL